MRLLRNLVLISIGFVMIINLATFISMYFSVGLDVQETMLGGNFDFREHFHGYRYFIDKIASFPGLETTLNVAIAKWCDVVGNYNIMGEDVGFNVLDTIASIFRIILAPIVVLFTVLVDIVKNIAWVVSFFPDLH